MNSQFSFGGWSHEHSILTRRKVVAKHHSTTSPHLYHPIITYRVPSCPTTTPAPAHPPQVWTPTDHLRAKNMPHRLLPMLDKVLIRKQADIESIND